MMTVSFLINMKCCLYHFQVFSSVLGSSSHIGKFLSGSGAGVTAVLLTYPLDTIRARLAFQVTGEHRYTGILHVATCIFREARRNYI